MKKQQSLWYLGGLAALLAGIGLDQWTKFLADTYLKDGADIVLIKNVFCLHYLEKRGRVWNVSGTENIFYHSHITAACRSILFLYFSPLYKTLHRLPHLYDPCGGRRDRKYDRPRPQ